MGDGAPPGGRREERDDAVGDGTYVLPPLERAPLAGRLGKALAVLRVIEQAERERGEDAKGGPPPPASSHDD